MILTKLYTIGCSRRLLYQMTAPFLSVPHGMQQKDATHVRYAVHLVTSILPFCAKCDKNVGLSGSGFYNFLIH